MISYERMNYYEEDFPVKRQQLPVVTKPRTLSLYMIGTVMLFFMVMTVFLLIFTDFLSIMALNDSDRSSPRPVILISMDGFRHDYLELVKAKRGEKSLPNFDRLLVHGVRVKNCTNSYPTITAPNHHTIVTGVHPQTHGIIANTIWDWDYHNETYDLDSQHSLDKSHWIRPELTDQHLPIWVELQESGFRVGSMLWPFTDQPIQGHMPDRMQSEYATLNMGDHGQASMDYEKRVARVLQWLDDKQEPLNFVMMYFEEPDSVGHAYGPDSEELADMVVELDRIMGLLLTGLDKLGIQADIILTADHGMTQLSADKMINIALCLNNGTYNYTWLSTSGFLYAKDAKDREMIYSNLTSCHPEMKVYKIAEVPSVEHFDEPPKERAPDFVLIASPGWVMVTTNRTTVPIAGNHGYSVLDREMNPILIFSGPSFYQNSTADEMHSVDIYATIAYIFSTETHPNNGTLRESLGPRFAINNRS